jgi:hypothetical protein
MRRLTITGFCAIALLSGCAGPQPKVVDEANIGLPCKGKDYPSGEWHIDNKPQVVFHTDGRCMFSKSTDFSFVGDDGRDPPPGFKRLTVTYPSATIVYSYDVSIPIPPKTGYKFTYTNDYSGDGNGSGIVKN